MDEAIRKAEGLQIEIYRRMGIQNPHLPIDQAVPVLSNIFAALVPLGWRIGVLTELINDQQKFLKQREAVPYG